MTTELFAANQQLYNLGASDSEVKNAEKPSFSLVGWARILCPR